MPYFFINFLENALDASMIAAFLCGPNARKPLLSNMSTMPIASGSSGATTVITMSSCALTNPSTPSRSVAAIGAHSAISEMPALPGKQ